MKKLLTPILLVLLVSGCSSMNVKPLEIFTTEGINLSAKSAKDSGTDCEFD